MQETPVPRSSHAVACFEHQAARILQFGGVQAQAPGRSRHADLRVDRRPGEESRSESDYFSDICDALDEADEVLVVGGRVHLADFRRFVENHRRSLAASITAYDVADQPTDTQLEALAHGRFSNVEPASMRPARSLGRPRAAGRPAVEVLA